MLKKIKCYRFQLSQDLGVEDIEIANGSGYVKFSDIKEAVERSDNNASLKLPSKADFMFFRAGLEEVCITDAEKIYKWFADQLQASG